MADVQDFANSSSSDDDDSVCSTESGTESKASCTVFVGSGLPSDIREKQIEEHFSVHGFEPFITKVVVPFNKATGTTKGLGFVTFNSREAAERAISIVNGTFILGKWKVKVKAYERKQKPRAPKPTATGDNTFMPVDAQLGHSRIEVYVGRDLPNHIKNDHIRAHFKLFEAYITNVQVERNRQTKQTKGYAIVTFTSMGAARDAVQTLNGSLLHGKFPLQVEEVQNGPVGTTNMAFHSTGQVPPAMSNQTSASVVILNFCGNEESMHLLLTSRGGIQYKSCSIDPVASTAVLELFSDGDARKAVTVLNGVTFLGQVIEASLRNLPGSRKQKGRPRVARKGDTFEPEQPLYGVGSEGGPISQYGAEPQRGPMYPNTRDGAGPQRGPMYPNTQDGAGPQRGPMYPNTRDGAEPQRGPMYPNTRDGAGPQRGPMYPNTRDGAEPQRGPMYPNTRDGAGHQRGPMYPNTRDGAEPQRGPMYPNTRDGAEPQRGPMYPNTRDGAGHQRGPMYPNTRDGAGHQDVSTYMYSKPQYGAGPTNTQYGSGPTNPQYGPGPTSPQYGAGPTNPQYGAGPQGGSVYSNPSSLELQMDHMSHRNPERGGRGKRGNPKAPKGGTNAEQQRPSYNTRPQESMHHQNLETMQHLPASHSESQFQTSDEIILTGDQWNRIIAVDAHGNSLHNELTFPFKTNPNIKIDVIMEKRGILLKGTPEAVQAAKQHIGRALEKLPLSVDKNKLALLIQFCPNLHSEIQKRHSVMVHGYEQGSSLVEFTSGSDSAIKCARQMFQEKLQQLADDEVPLLCGELVTSAKKRLENDEIQVLVSEVGTSLKLCSMEREEQERALIIVRGKPFEVTVKIPPNSAEGIAGEINDLQERYSVHMYIENSTVFIRGFVVEDVNAAFKSVRGMIAGVSDVHETLNCTPEQHMYLCKALIKKPTEQGKALRSSLPAELSICRGKISLCGSPEVVKKSCEEILRSDVFFGLKHHQTFQFTCSVAFISQIEEFVLKQFEDHQLDFTYYIPDTQRKPAGKKGAPVGKEKNKRFSITVYSGTPDHFSTICTEMESLSPCSKHHPLRQGATELADTIAKEVNTKYKRVRVKVKTQGKSVVVIHALNESDAQECWAEVEERINSKLTIEKFITLLSYCRLKYLEIKCSNELKTMNSNCESLFIPKVKQGQAPSIKLRGTVSQVAAIEEQLNALLDGYGEEEFEVSTTMYRMWSKRWRQLREDWDDTVLLFDQKATDLSSKQPHNPSDPTTVTFTVCGCNPEGIQRVKSMILDQESGNCVQTKTLELPPNGAMALLKGLKEKQLDIQNIAAEIEINKISNTVTITSPQMASDDMIKMEETIKSYIGDHSLKRETMTFSDPLVGLILTSPKYKYSDQLKAITQVFGVRPVIPKYPKGELSLTGIQSGVQVAIYSVQKLLTEIDAIISQVALPIPERYACIVNTKEFSMVCSSIQKEFCVVCIPPQEKAESSSQQTALFGPIYTLKGPQDSLESAKDKILETLGSLFSSKSISMPFGKHTSLEKKLEELARRHNVSSSVEVQMPKPGVKGGKLLKLEGAVHAVQTVIGLVHEEIINYQASADDNLPPEWQQPQSKLTELFDVAQGTPEWICVAQRFQHTMPQAPITSIQRIQNTWLWERYVQHKKRLHTKNNGVVNEMDLFHGTRNNDPKLIYESEDGFDMRYSAQGMWGMANYFAVNASYSHNYAHVNTATGKREMFLVKVLTGESYKCASNRSLRMPPPKPLSADPNDQLQFGQMKYDTVTGETNGSQVFMAYDNEKAYPAYLIQY